MTKRSSHQTYNTFEKIIQKKVYVNYLLYLPDEYYINKGKKMAMYYVLAWRCRTRR